MDTFIENSLKPASLGIVISLTVALTPWLKALFVDTGSEHVHPTPDNQPPLSVLLDFAAYLGNAQVPLGLILLGGTIGRLQVGNIQPGLWKTPVAVTILRIFVFPFVGFAVNGKLQEKGLFHDDTILYFISSINYCLPPATALIFFTAFFTPANSKQTVQMDILALIYIAHYICLVVCLPFTTVYTMKIALGF
ncbi:unnamed protein product [Ambrosiozyma monospora]|uniref:Unnamed protein product n=1 Tax=Ambrosiozyma monospora TaxID=43982 RepID=A0ACB5UCW3_AMBMO|nr:unnamed protein product [Ambrosiozyma monospora]